jgi:26S proteasome regulatory subunit N7
MADTFGVSVDFVDVEVARFVASGRLNCKVDKVGELMLAA